MNRGLAHSQEEAEQWIWVLEKIQVIKKYRNKIGEENYYVRDLENPLSYMIYNQ